MNRTETAMSLLQVVALVLPAIAIYLQFISSHISFSSMDDGEAANYHAIRLSMLYVLGAGVLLIVELVLRPPLGNLLIIGAYILLGLTLLTFILPILFSKVGLSDSRSILWPYKNAWDRLSDKIFK